MCATAALRDNASNWGEKGGCLGFFEYSFSLLQTKNIKIILQGKPTCRLHRKSPKEYGHRTDSPPSQLFGAILWRCYVVFSTVNILIFSSVQLLHLLRHICILTRYDQDQECRWNTFYMGEIRDNVWKKITCKSYSLCDNFWGRLAPISCLANGQITLLITTHLARAMTELPVFVIALSRAAKSRKGENCWSTVRLGTTIFHTNK